MRKADDRDSDCTTEVTSEDEDMPAAPSLDSSTHYCKYFSKPAVVKTAGNILLLFSGPRSHRGNLTEQLANCGFVVNDYDIANGEQFDLTDDAIWYPLYRSISAGEYQAVFSSPPCGTFSRVRNVPGGPPPLRGSEGTDRYGFCNLPKHHAEQVRKHNLLAIRTAKATQAMINLERIAVVEQPAVREGEVSMLLLDEFVQLRKHMEHTKSVQCAFGADATKLTSWLTYGVKFTDMTAACQHAPRDWYEEGTGTKITKPHPPARGRRRFFSTISEALNAIKPTAQYVTTNLAYYTPLLNRYIALKFKLACSRQSANLHSKPASQATQEHESVACNWNQRMGREAVHFSQPMRGTTVDLKMDEERRAVGGLRDAANTLKKLTASAEFGQKLGLDLMAAVTNNMLAHRKAGTLDQSWVATMCGKIGSEDSRPAPAEAVEAIRAIIVKHTGHTDETRQSPDSYCTTDVDAKLLQSWRRAANDPDHAVPRWLETGAPAGTARSSHSDYTKLFC